MRESERGSRERKEGNFQNLKFKNSIFVANIPWALDIFGLKGIFSKIGEVVSASIPTRLGRKPSYGFVRFSRNEDVFKAIQSMNNKNIRGRRIVVEEVVGRKNRRPNHEWRKGPNIRSDFMRSTDFRKEAGIGSKEEGGNNNLRRVVGELNEELVEKLSRSLVIEIDRLMDVKDLETELVGRFAGLEKVKNLQRNVLILQFANSELAKEALTLMVNNHEEFLSAKASSEFDSNELREVWVEIRGVPPSGWKETNFIKIASRWGHYVGCRRNIKDSISFEVMEVLIMSKIMTWIEEEVWFSFGNTTFRVCVREEKISPPTGEWCMGKDGSSSSRSSRHQSPHRSPKKTYDDVVSGTKENKEDKEDGEMSMDSDHGDEQAAEESCKINSKANSDPNIDDPGKCPKKSTFEGGLEDNNVNTINPEVEEVEETVFSTNSNTHNISNTSKNPVKSSTTTERKRKAEIGNELKSNKKNKEAANEDIYRASAIRCINLGSRLGVKVISNKEGVIRQSIRDIKKHRRYTKQNSPDSNSTGSIPF